MQIGGNFTKDRMAGPIEPPDTIISTCAMRRVLSYDPRDLTISVEAGLPYVELQRVLAENRQMLPLDPPFGASATVGGVVASNSTGPRRRLYGTARDCVIGMKFATVEGRLVQSGGMVVKNVAGLDMAKLMIGSFGTLAAIAVVNFKVFPMPLMERIFVLRFDSLAAAMRERDRVLATVLQPSVIDLLNPEASAMAGLGGYALLIGTGGSEAVLERYSRELASCGTVGLDALQEFTPRFLETCPEAAVVRVSSPLSDLEVVIESSGTAVLARAGNGVSYLHFPETAAAVEWLARTRDCGWKTVVEFAPPSRKASLDLWPVPGRDLELMRRVKCMFDPNGVLNRGRLYGRI